MRLTSGIPSRGDAGALPVPPTGHPAQREAAARTAGGFSLIEVLVCIAVIGILIAILVPTLSSARGSARQTVCLSNLRGLGSSFDLYLQRYRDTFPFAAPGQSIPTSPEDADDSFIMAGYWDLSFYWTGLLREVAPWRQSFRAWVCPGSPRRTAEPWVLEPPDGPSSEGFPSYAYSNSFIARPEVWGSGATADPSFLAPVRTTDLTFPASKVLLFDAEQAHLTGRNADRGSPPVLFGDGHGGIRKKTDATAPVVNPFSGSLRRFHDTPGGARGRDY